MREDFRDAPEGARERAREKEETKGPQSVPTDPALPGTRAMILVKPICLERASEDEALGSRGDANRGKVSVRDEHHPNNPPQGGAVGHRKVDDRNRNADRNHPPETAGADAKTSLQPRSPKRQRTNPATAGQIDGDHPMAETQTPLEPVDLRFTDPLVGEIVQLHRMRRRWLKAKNALILQGKALGRAECDGDKDAGSAAFDRVMKGKPGPGDEHLVDALAPFAEAIRHFDLSIAPIEKHLVRLAKRLPIAPWVESVTGLGFGSVASIVGEAGDLSAYPSVAGVWKRMGLAVIDGDGRQRRVANAEAALIHGYNPERRAVIWVMADSMSKLQRTWLDKETGEVRKPAGPYGEVLEREKAKALAAGLSKQHAENRGKRHMSKAVLRDMTLEWRRAVGQAIYENQRRQADRPQFLEAAE